LVRPYEEKSFVHWMRSHGVLYSGDEYHFRLGVFLATCRLVRSHNRARKGFTLTLNHLATHTREEYNVMLGHRSMPNRVPRSGSVPSTKAAASPPGAWDWRDKGIVNAIKDQQDCGSCWAFSVVQAQESQWALHNQELYSLSEQNLVDCVTTCLGCDGGDEGPAYRYEIDFQSGLWNLESDYPYEGKKDTCRFASHTGVAPIHGYESPTSGGNETALLIALYNDGVASIGVDTSSIWFQLYSGGIFDNPHCSSTSLDHAVGLIGYGTVAGTGFWIVRDSWGTDWGEGGYIRMIRNQNNQCGVATEAIIPRL
jgi:cathepsin L